MVAACFSPSRRRGRQRLVLASIVVLASALGSTAAAAVPQIAVRGELAFCNGQPVDPVGGALRLNSACGVTLQIEWLQGMKQAYVEFSSDSGATWHKDPVPLSFPVVAPGSVSGV